MRDRSPQRLLSLFLAVAGGAFLWAAFPDVGWWPGAFVAVALLWWALREDHAWWNTLYGFAFGITFFLPHVRWAINATEVAPWIAMSVIEALFLALFGALWTWARRAVRAGLRGRDGTLIAGAAQAAAFAVVFTAVEQWRSEIPFGGFPWGRLAWAMVDAPLGRAAWLGGTVLVTLAVCLTGLWLAAAVHAIAARPRAVAAHGRAAGMVVAAAAIVVAPATLPLPASSDAGATGDGATLHDAGTDLAEDGVLRAGAVQGNVDDPDLGVFAARPELFGNHLAGTYELAEELAGQLDIVLWPEDSTGVDPRTSAQAAAALDAAATAVGAPVLVGTQEYPADGGRYNLSLLWQAGQGATERYAKQHPAPFGEYIPLRPLVRLLSDQVDRVTTDMLPGDQPAVMDIPAAGGDTRIATIICFEVAYDEIVRDAVRHGAQVLVVPTNNAAFGWTEEATQQLAMTRMQAITTGRAAVQVSTVGVSGIVTPDGTLVASAELFTHDTLAATLPLRHTITPAVAAGYWPGWIAGIAAVLLAAAGVTARIVTRVTERRVARTAPAAGGPAGRARPSATDAATDRDALVR
ncbi:apolipoprotein N-acyltransferase [Myceligenerans pegani]|uniref:Apolipoprotein N-acyltransferase n=1 Tax=Myceligenerans pegani TaxID=2776917 RepID=A0ABR9MU73_9MICO|nr:apolipoprotein N-acyltransferase [Myceligenerans sp. TRM 65318]MBE1874924.1 apolipoprotein N-acyltransferase [Myceligenerans sp. TRM 65318]MBE3017195.1 apolipoprotein N-acyltransferase [Myceligenerans sp. TRM 65318]